MPSEAHYRRLCKDVDAKAKTASRSKYPEGVRGCASGLKVDDEGNPVSVPTPRESTQQVMTIPQYRETMILANREMERAAVVEEFIEDAETTLEGFLNAWCWDAFIIDWRYVKNGSADNRALRIVRAAARKRWARGPWKRRLSSHADEPWFKRLRLKQTVALRRKGPPKGTPEYQDALEGAASFRFQHYPEFELMKMRARSHFEQETWAELVDWLLKGQRPQQYEPSSLDRFLEFLRGRLGEEWLGKELLPRLCSDRGQLAPGDIADRIAAKLYGVAINDLQRYQRDLRRRKQ